MRRPDSSLDTRALWLHRLTASPVARLMGLVHGTLLPLHDLLSAAAAAEPLGQGPDLSELTPCCCPASVWSHWGGCHCCCSCGTCLV